MRSWRNGIRATLRSLWRKLLGGSSPLDRTIKEKIFLKILILFLLFFTNKVIGASYMMNCVSLDFKKTAFYKLQIKKNNQKSLLMRPIKSKWVNFCESYFDEKVSCSFESFKVNREGLISLKDNKVSKSNLIVDFYNYTLKENVTVINNKNSIKENKETNYKCRKIILN